MRTDHMYLLPGDRTAARAPANGRRARAPAILTLASIGKRYGPVTALHDVDLSIAEGEFLTLLGPSGSGKTTLLNLIAGVVSPTNGRILLRDQDISALPPRQRGFGMVFQNYALMPHMSVFENVAFPLRVRRLSEPEIRRKVTDALALVQLPHVAERKPRELSGGQQQRIAIARSLVYSPPIILMDEPLGALDKKLRDQMQLEIKRLHSELGVTVLYVTHDQEEALVLSDRICLMNNGRIEQLGTPSELYFYPASVFAADFLGESNILEGVLRIGGPEPVVIGPTGALIRLPSQSTVRAGDQVKFMVRPEYIRLLGEGENATNEVEGVISAALFVGSVTRTYVQLADGTTLITKTLSGTAPAFEKRGMKVRLGWSPDCTVILSPQAGLLS